MTAIVGLAEILTCGHAKTHDIVRRHFTDIRLPSNTISSKKLLLLTSHITLKCDLRAVTPANVAFILNSRETLGLKYK